MKRMCFKLTPLHTTVIILQSTSYKHKQNKNKKIPNFPPAQLASSRTDPPALPSSRRKPPPSLAAGTPSLPGCSANHGSTRGLRLPLRRCPLLLCRALGTAERAEHRGRAGAQGPGRGAQEEPVQRPRAPQSPRNAPGAALETQRWLPAPPTRGKPAGNPRPPHCSTPGRGGRSSVT